MGWVPRATKEGGQRERAGPSAGVGRLRAGGASASFAEALAEARPRAVKKKALLNEASTGRSGGVGGGRDPGRPIDAADRPQQQQPPVFRSTIETVAVPTTVFDRAGDLVTNLALDDFKVFDDGYRQAVTNFISGLQPISAVVLVDSSASMTTSLERARLAAEQFIIRLRPGDQARVGTFNDKVIISDAFTGNRDALLRTLRENDRFANPTRLFDAIDEAMTLLEPLGGRRVVVVMTDGCDTGSQTSWDTLRRRFMSEEQMLYMVPCAGGRHSRRARAPARRLRNPRGLGADDRHPAERVLQR